MLITGITNMIYIGPGGVRELTEAQYGELAAAFNSAADAPPPGPEVPGDRGKGGEGPDHLRLKSWVAANPQQATGESGMKHFWTEYSFSTGDRIDVLLQDREGRPVAVEIELAQAAHQTEGFYQAVKYRALVAARWRRPADGARAFLIAHTLAPEIKEMCAHEGIEWREIPKDSVDL